MELNIDEGKYILEYNEYRCVVEKFSGTESVYWGYVLSKKNLK